MDTERINHTIKETKDMLLDAIEKLEAGHYILSETYIEIARNKIRKLYYLQKENLERIVNNGNRM